MSKAKGTEDSGSFLLLFLLLFFGVCFFLPNFTGVFLFFVPLPLVRLTFTGLALDLPPALVLILLAIPPLRAIVLPLLDELLLNLRFKFSIISLPIILSSPYSGFIKSP